MPNKLWLLTLFHFINFVNSIEQTPKSYYIRTESGRFLHGRYDVSATSIGGGKVLDTVMNARLDETRNLRFAFNGPFIEGEPYRGNRWCLDCRNGSAGCDVDMHPCHISKNHFWLIKIHPNQTEAGNGQLMFSIFSELHPTECLTYRGEEMNNFKLEHCEDPPTAKQNLYIGPNYLDLVQEVQELKILRHFYNKPEL